MHLLMRAAVFANDFVHLTDFELLLHGTSESSE